MEQGQLVTIGGVLLVLLAVIVYNNVMAARGRKAPKAQADGSPHPAVDPMLCKFAHHEGETVGETVAIDGDRLILKQSGEFKAVPLAQASEKGGDVVLTGDIDWAKAKEAGAAWHAARKKLDDAVTANLTKSEDVKSPALEAFKKREGET